ncbi:hypothetical protein ARMGADRAFT_1025175 [Armillaria gallica]|uniref:Uncharacterized protein n=1 Tax=Armillaria gallica TaxID=47427 RepID=A0A2H3ECW4_ARMGA|nr:hypothetical protein ARMGADRAFT_1025175 [Armillaria gallica]
MSNSGGANSVPTIPDPTITMSAHSETRDKGQNNTQAVKRKGQREKNFCAGSSGNSGNLKLRVNADASEHSSSRCLSGHLVSVRALDAVNLDTTTLLTPCPVNHQFYKCIAHTDYDDGATRLNGGKVIFKDDLTLGPQDSATLNAEHRAQLKKTGYMIAGKTRIDVGTTTRRQLDERCCASLRGYYYEMRLTTCSTGMRVDMYYEATRSIEGLIASITGTSLSSWPEVSSPSYDEIQ